MAYAMTPAILRERKVLPTGSWSFAITRAIIPKVAAWQVVELPAAVERERDEQLGTKPKFWFRHVDGERWLFKFARPNTGEHWAEKVASEVAQRLNLPHARIELARFEGHWGSISRDFTNRGRHDLVHGNELLTELDPQYPAGDTYHVRAHTLEAILGVLRQDFVAAPRSEELPTWLAPFDVFVGYLLLDALIGNTDRHHENWGILITSSQPRRAELAPTFDHASSLGRELADKGRHQKYAVGGHQYRVADYLQKARSALFETAGSTRPMSPQAAFQRAGQIAPPASQYWLDRLRQCSHELRGVVDSVPDEAMSRPAREFCVQLLGFTAQTLLQ
jgi:HipA-like protein